MSAPENTEECADGSPHIFLEDGGETPGGVSCAICDLEYSAWLTKFYPAKAEALRQSKESTPC